MTNQAYPTLPGYAQWLKDSTSRGNRVRNKDKVLNRIDELIDAASKADNTMRQWLLVDLFWCLDHWLKAFRKDPDMEASRESAIFKLYVTVVNELCNYFKCQSNTLVNKLEEAFGRSIDEHGLEVDVKRNWVKYFSDAERKLYKLRFKNGLVYQRQWWQEKPNLSEFVPVESSRASDPKAFFGNWANKTNYAGFVMSMSRDFYMAKHGGPSRQGSRVFHSSYLGNNLVSCAGTMLVQGGVIKVICPDSGHFKPGDVNVMMMLCALSMQGVDLQKVVVQDFNGFPLGTAQRIQQGRNWQKVLEHLSINRKQLEHNQKKLRELTEPQRPQQPTKPLSPVPVYISKTAPQVNCFYETPIDNPVCINENFYRGNAQTLQQLYMNALEMDRIFYN